MAAKLLSLMFVAGYFWSPVKSQCPTLKCNFKSVYRHANRSTRLESSMKVEVQSGTPTGISFLGRNRQRNVTEFLIEKCSGTSGKVVITIQWNLNRNYFLAVKAGQITFERLSTARTSTATDDHRFYLANASTSPNHVTLKSKTANTFIMTDSQGQSSLGSDERNRMAWFQMRFCKTV